MYALRLIAVASAVCLPHASAAVITPYDRATFQLAVSGGGIQSEDFDGIANGTILGSLGGVTYSASGGSVIVTDTYLTTTPPNGIGSTSVGYFLGNETATFTFDSPITAFAIDVNTYDAIEGGYSATLDTGDVIFSKFDVFPGFATGQFIGFTSDMAFSSVTIAPINNFTYTLDTLIYGEGDAVTNPVPEPSALVLLIGALGALSLMHRRRRL